jgi:hypothetical protein
MLAPRITTGADYRRRRIEADRSGRGAGRVGDSLDKTPFQQILDDILPPERIDARDLNHLWSDLPEAERQLLAKASEENLKRYRDLVFAIARETLKRNTRIKKIRRKTRSGDTVELTVVEFLDDRLQKMANLIHAPGNSAFQMLKTVEEIRGALIDVRE